MESEEKAQQNYSVIYSKDVNFCRCDLISDTKAGHKILITARFGGSMVTYGGMSKQPVTVPVVR